MKIGQVMDKYNVTRETLHYYIKAGLLYPKKMGGLYDFDDSNLETLEFIFRLKAMNFHIKEIDQILTLKRLNNWVEPETILSYLSLLKGKQKEIEAQMANLTAALDLIKTEMEQTNRCAESPSNKMGVPLAALQYLACPNCGSPLTVDNGQFSYRYIYEGNLTCTCGYCATIRKGVILTGDTYDGAFDRPDLHRELYKDLSKDWLAGYFRCAGQITKALSSPAVKGKVVLEANANGNFYLYNHLKEIEWGCLFIVVDKYPETLQMYQSLIERLGLDVDILFIANAGMNLPLKPESVDILIDFFGSNEWHLYHEDSFLTSVAPYLSCNVKVLGAYSSLPPHSESRKAMALKYPESSSRSQNLELLRNDYQNLGYEISTERASIVLNSSDTYFFACHKDGEPMEVVSYVATRRGQG